MVNVVALLGTILAVGLNLSPIVLFYELFKGKRDLKSIPEMMFVIGVFCSTTNLAYGILKDDFNFVANLIDYFSLDYNYTYTSIEDIKYDLTYGITAELVVYDSDNSAKPIEKRPFVLMEDTKLTGTGQIIKVDILR